MEHVSNDHEDRPSQHENNLKLCDETGHPVLSLLEIQWELRQSKTEGKAISEQILASEKRNKSKRAGL